jgi:hypothetical protein
MNKSFYTTCTTLVAVALLLAACNLPLGGSTSTQMPASGGEATQPPNNAGAQPPAGGGVPTNPPAGGGISYVSYPTDPTTILAATKDEVFPSDYGDDHSIDLYERPFQLDNIYRPDADIIWTFISDEGEWYYFSTQIVGPNPGTKTMDTPYGIEIDVDLDGRGDFLLWATPPYFTNWTKDNIQFFTDANNDVGNRQPLISDAPSKGDGYEILLFDRGSGSDPDTAWVRQAPLDPTYLQIAVKKNVIADADFLWGAWTDFGLANPGLFDYNDFFTVQEAGSPYASSPYFPLKALFGMDNTCRVAYGFTPVGTEPDLCGGAKSTAIPPTQQTGGGYTGVPVLVQQTPTFTPQPPSVTQPPKPPPTQPPAPATGVISGFVYWDMNGDGAHDAGEAGESSLPVYLYSEGCTAGIASTTPDSNGHYSFPDLPLGTYCVQYSPPSGYNLGAPGGTVDGVGVNDVMPSRVDFRILPPG